MRDGFRANLARRAATAAVVLPALLAAILLGPPYLFTVVVAAAVLAGMDEFHRLLASAGVTPLKGAGWAALAAAFVDAAAPFGRLPPLWPAAIVGLALAALRRSDGRAGAIGGAAATLLGAGYLGGLGGTIAALRLLEPLDQGPWRVLFLVAVIMAADTGAYFVGHALGRRPLAPRISPGKTVEGALGGVVGGALAAVAVRGLGLPAVPLEHAVVLGVLVTVLGAVGDLFESLLKRWAGVKDSGGLFPGHGGMLDRLDSLLLGAPVLYYYFLIAV